MHKNMMNTNIFGCTVHWTTEAGYNNTQKVKVCHLYSASSELLHFWSAQHGSRSFLHSKYTMPPLLHSSPGGATTEWTVIAPADEAYYSFIDPVRMKGWVGLVGWPTADGLPISMVTHQLQVRCRPVKLRQSETDVLPLSHPTNTVTTQECMAIESQVTHKYTQNM